MRTLEQAVSVVGKSLKQAAHSLGFMAQLARFQNDHEEYIRDPRYGVPVSRFGNAKAPIVRETVRATFGANDQGNRVKDQLDRWREAGVITDNAYHAGRAFGDDFERCGYDRCRTTNLVGTHGGGVGIEDILTRSADARNYVHTTIKALGGPTSRMSLAVVHIVGFKRDIKSLANQMGTQSRDYWTGTVQAALELMGEDYKRMLQGKRRSSAMVGIASDDHTTPDKGYVIIDKENS